MNTVTFGEYNSFDDLGLLLTAKTIGAATPKTLTIDIVGGDGELDYTEYFGKVNYNNRILSFEFSVISDSRYFLQKYSRLKNLLNGKKMKVILSDDADFYYMGRVTVNEWKSEKSIGKVAIDVNAEPYKLKRARTVVSRTITGETIITCPNLSKQAVPKISSTEEAVILLGEYSESENEIVFNYDNVVKANSSLEDDNIIFKEGDNILKIVPKNTAVVNIEYQEGEL